MDSLENLRVLAGSKDFFRGLQHQYPPVQIRSAPLLKGLRNVMFLGFFFSKITEIMDTVLIVPELSQQSV